MGCRALDFGSQCTRISWAAYLPFSIAIFSLLIAIWKGNKTWRTFLAQSHATSPGRYVKPLFTFWTPYLTLEEAVSLQAAHNESTTSMEIPDNDVVGRFVGLWIMYIVSLLQALVWLAVFSYAASTAGSYSAQIFFISITWLYISVKLVTFPSQVVMYDVFAVALANLVGAIFLVYSATGQEYTVVWGASLNLVGVILFLSAIMSMPMDSPPPGVLKEEIGKTVSTEDYTSLWGWVTFMWIYPVVKKGRNTTLHEKDVYNLSPKLQARPVYIKFLSSRAKETTFLIHLIKANGPDMAVDFFGTILSVIFEYTSPYFLKKILDTLDLTTHPDGTPKTPLELADDRNMAYVYAFLMFFATYLKSQADLQHLWVNRRASTRARTQLMTAIYEKSLKRVALMGDPKSGDSTEGDKKSGADLGKIVNLMTADVNSVMMLMQAVYFLYANPIQVIVGSVMLYQLMGPSIFAGLLVLVVGVPLNSVLSKRAIKLYEKTSGARDKRMSNVSEIINSIKFIKFFAWEQKWIERVLESRAVEIGWLIKNRINDIMFSFYWNCAPISISVITFLVFVMNGNQLTVGKAFTALQLFSLLRLPMMAFPMILVHSFSSWVSLQRIISFLGEDEVTAQVSSLPTSGGDDTDIHPGDNGKLPAETNDELLRGAEDDSDDSVGLGLDRATLKWNESKPDPADELKQKQDREEQAPTESQNRKWLSWPKFLRRKTTSPEPGSVPSEGPGTLTLDAPPIDGDQEDQKFLLQDISVIFPEGQLSVIVGPTASGKTAMLMALLGEMTLLEGRVVMSKRKDGLPSETISYASQQPWLRHQSIKDNILFGQEYDKTKYNEVVESCALKPDFDMLEDGDITEIGARGVSLSGGQKARVALARAVYSPSKYVLLDDPLSAVDSHTARFLYEKLLCGPLLAGRTIILVTHHVELVLPSSHYLVRMLDGRIDTQGTIFDLRAQGVLDEITHDESTEAHKQEEKAEEEEKIITEETEEAKKKPRKLVDDEHREEGSVRFSVYDAYLRASTYWVWGFVGLGIIFNQAAGVAEKLWINVWGSAYSLAEQSPSSSAIVYAGTGLHDSQKYFGLGDSWVSSHFTSGATNSSSLTIMQHSWPDASDHPLYYVGIYAAICFSSAFIEIIAAAVQYFGAIRASKALFKRLLSSVVGATFRFHDTTPAGRLLNRFGKDIETIDGALPESLRSVNDSLASFFACLIVITVVFPIFLIPAIIIGFLYYQLSIGYLNAGRDLRRMEANSKSPIYSGFSELLEGIVTVRAFAKERQFLEDFYTKVDATTQMWYTFWMTNRWLLVNFDVLGATTTLITTLLCINYLQGDAGLAGVCITSAMSFYMSVYWACRFYTQLEMDLNSIERVTEYLDLPQEPPAIIDDSRPPAYWPSSSSNNALVAIEDLEIKYAPDLPSVLQGVSIELKAGERVGILGRTGSGKSTLAMSLFRFVDPSSGKIIIDGIDISKIGVYDLRSRMTFIPQDATLFSGTIRDNLDPFGEHEDSDCLDVLYRVHLINSSGSTSQLGSRAPSGTTTPRPASPTHEADASIADEVAVPITDQPNDATSSTAATVVDTGRTSISLTTKVAAGGTNFSQGQRQLIAMARALLRRSSIVVMDEATSSIDFATDEKIQKTVREEFTGALLITIAHRLRTIVDYDRLVVLDKGKVAEFDTPLNLIEQEGSIFRSMCMKSGTFKELLDVALKQRGEETQREEIE